MNRLRHLVVLLVLLAAIVLPLANVVPVIAADVAVNTYNDNTTSLVGSGMPYARNTFFAVDRHWVFYSDGVALCFKSATDGSTWSSPTAVRALTGSQYMNTWSDDTYVYYALSFATANTAILWRRGLLNSDGTITWSAAEQTVVAGVVGQSFYGVGCSVDSSGKGYVSYCQDGVNKSYAVKNTAVDGTWSTDAAWPKELGASSGLSGMNSPIPLLSEGMLFVYSYASSETIRSRVWHEDTDTLDAEVATDGQISYYTRYSAAAIDGENDVHLVYNEKTSYDINHEMFDYSAGDWTTVATVHAATLAYTSPVLSASTVDNHLYCFYFGHPDDDHIYYQEYDGANWGAAVQIIADEVATSHYAFGCSYKDGGRGGYIGVVWTKDAASPYTLRYFGLDTAVAPVAVTNAASLVEETTARLNGEMFSAGGVTLTTRGFQYDTNSGVPYASDIHEDGAWWMGGSSYHLDVDSLTEGEAYYYRAYVTNRVGTAYGAEEKFLTKPVAPNTFDVVLHSATELEMTWVAGAGADVVSIRALENSSPALDRSDGVEVYNGALLTYTDGGLALGEHWYYRAWSYCTEDGMTQWSDDSVADDDIVTVAPKTVTLAATDVLSFSTTLNGEIESTGGQNNTVRGFEWDVDAGAPYANDWHEHGSFGIATFSHNEAGLLADTDYYFRAYSTNPAGTTYGLEFSFHTMVAPPDCPTAFVVIDGVDNVTVSWVMGLGADNTMVIRRVGGYPDTMADGELVYNGVGTTFTDNAPNVGEVEYYYRAWSWNVAGYSSCYASAFTGGAIVAASIGMIAVGLFIICGLGINVMAFWQKKWWVCPIAFLYFVAVGYYTYTTSAGATAGVTTFDAYKMFTWVCALFALVSLGELWYIFQGAKVKPEPEDDMPTKNRKRMESNLSRTFNRQKSPAQQQAPRTRQSGGFPPRSTGDFPKKS